MPADRVRERHPWHIVLVLDDSLSMKGAPAKDVNEAVTAMLAELKILTAGSKDYFRISTIKFGSRPHLLSEAASEKTLDASQIAILDGGSGSTDAAAALDEAIRVLTKNPGNPTDFTPYVFFLSDGAPDDVRSALDVGMRLKKLDIAAGTPRVITIGFGNVNHDFMSTLATQPELYKCLKESKEISKLFPSIGTIATMARGTEAVDQAFINL